VLGFGSLDIEVFYERQVVFNSDLEVLMRYDDPEKKYADYYAYSEKFHGAAVTWENAGRFVPFLELLIVRQFVNHFFYRESYISHEGIMPRVRQRIGEAVRAELETFEKERGMIGILCPHLFRSDRRKAKAEKENKLVFARELKTRYKDLQERIRMMLDESHEVSRIALELGIPALAIQGHLLREKPQIADVAALGLLAEMEKSGLARKLSIHEIDHLKDEILNRSPEKAFPKRARLIKSPHKKMYPTESIE